MSKASKDGECFYGRGDKATQLNLKGKRLENFATDQYAFQKDQLPFKINTIEVDNVKISFDHQSFEDDNYLILDKEFTELHIIGE